MKALELISASATAAAATGAAMAALTGDSLTVRNSRGAARIVGLWADVQTSGWLQLTYPSGHDQTRCIRARTLAGNCDMLWSFPPIAVQPQETLSLTLAEGAVGGDVGTAHLLLLYDDLPGIQARFVAPGSMKVESLLTIDLSITAGAGPAYSGEELITAESDLLRANRDYALLGIRPNVNCGAIYLKAPDFGNLRIGVPGEQTQPRMTSNFFAHLSMAAGEALIPVFNSGNKSGIYCGVSQDENATAVTASIYLALLR